MSVLKEHKGIDMVIRAFPKVISKVPGAIYVVAGMGSDAEMVRLQKIVRELNMEPHIIFTGSVTGMEIPQLYNLCDVYIMPSRVSEKDGESEGFGISYLEANACLKPVIGGNSGGVPDAIEDGVTGFLVNPNDVNYIAEKLITLFTNKDLAKSMGIRGCRRIERSFTWMAIARKIKNLLN